MEALNGTVDQRRANIKDALHAWAATSRRGRVRAQVSENYQIVGPWVDKGEELVIETDDVACLFAHELRRLSQPGIKVDAWVFYGETESTPDMLVIDVEGVVLGIHVEADDSSTPFTLHVRVLDSLPTVRVTCSLGRDVHVEVSDYMHMWWTLGSPTRRQVGNALRNLIHAAHHFRGDMRVNRMFRIDAALAGVGMESVHAHNYRDLVDWLTPMTGIDPGGEGWEREKFLTLTGREDPENYRTEYIWSITHEGVAGELEIRITNYEKRQELYPVSMIISDKRGRRSTINAPTHADIADAIAKWVMLNSKEEAK